VTLSDRIFGRPLANADEAENKIGVLSGVPTLGLDALGSASFILAAKFTAGAWVTLLLIPGALFVFYRIKRHYVSVARQTQSAREFNPDVPAGLLAVVPIEGWNRLAEEALRFATRISGEVVAVHVTSCDNGHEGSAANPAPLWRERVEDPSRRAGVVPPRLVVLDSPYRQLSDPLLDYVKRLQDEQPPGRLLAVIIPELFQTHWYENLLHNDRAKGLQDALRALKDRRIVVIRMPWFLEENACEAKLLRRDVSS
jgi:hypothetical protein